MKILKDRWYLKLLLLAILLRVLIIPFYFHPDIKTYHFQAQFLSKGVINIYDYLLENRQKLPLKEEFVYFPLTYLFLGGYQILVTPFLGPNFNEWLFDSSGQAAEDEETFKYLFLLKLPYLLLDLVIAFLLVTFFKSERDRKTAFVIWLFNPFSFIILYMFSNVDIVPVTLSLLSLILARNQKLLLAALILGIAAGFKAYPILFLPVLVIFSKNIKQMLLAALMGVIPLVLIILPFWSDGFQVSAFASGLTTRIFAPVIPISGGESLMLVLLGLGSLLMFGIQFQKKSEVENIWKYFLAILLIVFSFIHFHIQWLLWMMPLLAILIVKEKKFILPSLVLVVSSMMIPLLFNDKFMSVALLGPINLLYGGLPSAFGFFQKFADPLLIQSLLHSLFAGTSLVLVWQIFKEEV